MIVEIFRLEAFFVKWFSLDSPFNRFMGKIADIIILSIIWILFCLPVITIGPATTAMYYVVLRLHDPSCSVLKDFFRSFKQNFVQSLVAELFAGVMLFLVYMDFAVLVGTSFGKDTWPWILFGIILFAAAAWTSWVFPMLSKFECGWGQLFKTPIKLSILHFLTTIIIALINLLPVILYFGAFDIFMSVLPILIFLGPAGLAYINCIQLKKAFKWYIPVEPTVDEEESEEETEEETEEEALPEEAEN